MFKGFFNWFAGSCLNCRDAARLVSESCERDLTFGERMKLKVLCMMCPFTNRYNQQIGKLHNRLGKCEWESTEVMKDASLSDECKQRLKEEMLKNKSS